MGWELSTLVDTRWLLLKSVCFLLKEFFETTKGGNYIIGGIDSLYILFHWSNLLGCNLTSNQDGSYILKRDETMLCMVDSCCPQRFLLEFIPTILKCKAINIQAIFWVPAFFYTRRMWAADPDHVSYMWDFCREMMFWTNFDFKSATKLEINNIYCLSPFN